MTEPNELTYDDVMRFLMDRGGRSTNRELVSYFRPLLNDPVNQVTNRLQFRDIVNNIANVREEQGEKYVCLKEKYICSYNEDNKNEFESCNTSNEDLDTSYNSIPTIRNMNRPPSYQPYWRYRLSSNANLVPPPPLLSFRFCGNEEANSLPINLSGSSQGLPNCSSSDDSFECHPDRLSSLNNDGSNYYHPIHREDPTQLDSSWIHEQGPRYHRYYSEPRDVDWPGHMNGSLYNCDRPRHNSIAAGSLLETTEQDYENKQVSVKSIKKDDSELLRKISTESSEDGESLTLNNSNLSKADRDDANPNVRTSSRDKIFSQNHEIDNKENIGDLNKNPEVHKDEVEERTDDNIIDEYRPHSESVKERARRIDNMANEQQSSLIKTPLPSSGGTPSKLKAIRSEKVSDDNLSVASQLDSKLRRQWFVKAAQSDYHGMVALLKKEPRLAGIRDITSGFTALHWGAKHGNAEVVKLIAGTHKVNPDVKSHGGYTCLHIATLYKHKSIVDLLIRTYGANPTIRDNSGKRADQYPPDYVSYTAGVNRRPADPRTSKAFIYLSRRTWSSLKSSPKNKQVHGKRIANIRRALRRNRSESESYTCGGRKISMADTL